MLGVPLFNDRLDCYTDYQRRSGIGIQSLDIDILLLSPSETRGTYVFEQELDRDNSRTEIVCATGRSLIFARQRLLGEIAKRNYNVFLQEG